jgi:hypothetical protein
MHAEFSARERMEENQSREWCNQNSEERVKIEFST